jgi:hypothetical protein
MPVCEICGVVDRVYTCADSGVEFRKDCGDPDPKRGVCALCSTYNAPEGIAC